MKNDIKMGLEEKRKLKMKQIKEEVELLKEQKRVNSTK